MGIPWFSLNFGDKEIATLLSNIGESLRWGKSHVLGNNMDKFPQNIEFHSEDGDSIPGECGLTSKECPIMLVIIEFLFLLFTNQRLRNIKSLPLKEVYFPN